MSKRENLHSNSGVSNSNCLEGYIPKKNVPRYAVQWEKAYAGHKLLIGRKLHLSKHLSELMRNGVRVPRAKK
jgi:hypothetical protein